MTPTTTVKFAGSKVRPSWLAFAKLIPGGMIISDAPAGKTKPPFFDEVAVEEGDEDEVLDVLLAEFVELEELEEEKEVVALLALCIVTLLALFIVTLDVVTGTWEVDTDVLVVTDGAAGIPENV
ncbi:MAG: hypothetical protein OK456_03235 [Thaumarchaeota archaeon]|nr:hypothetical protein [Nitrososphaerota archaeon]